MKVTVKIVGIIAMIWGGMAIIGSLATGTGMVDGYGIVGGLLLFISGLIPVIYVYSEE